MRNRTRKMINPLESTRTTASGTVTISPWAIMAESEFSLIIPGLGKVVTPS
jgi:hypothetical protein